MSVKQEVYFQKAVPYHTAKFNFELKSSKRSGGTSGYSGSTDGLSNIVFVSQMNDYTSLRANGQIRLHSVCGNGQFKPELIHIMQTEAKVLMDHRELIYSTWPERIDGYWKTECAKLQLLGLPNNYST